MQYLVNWRLFLKNKCKDFPAQLCFPQFFYLCMVSISPYYWIPKEDVRREPFLNVVEQFYNDLQSIVNIIFTEEIQLISAREMKEKIRDVQTPEICYLETFIKDEAGRLNYQNALLSTSLKFYGMKNTTQLVSYLRANDCCTEEEKELVHPPPSKHYVTLNTNCTLKRLFYHNTFGPEIWGPYYWAIFHALAEGNIHEKEIPVLNNYIHILPTIIPCEECRRNYYLHVKPNSQVKEITTKKEAIACYSNVHNAVTRHLRGR